jgi:hypothetical protein
MGGDQGVERPLSVRDNIEKNTDKYSYPKWGLSTLRIQLFKL